MGFDKNYMKDYITENYVGKKFNMLTVLEYIGSAGGNKKRSIVRVRCDCGVIKELPMYAVKHGKPKSCGCIQNQIKHGLCSHPLHHVWTDMNDRCYNPNSDHYYRYGGRGVTVSERWRYDFKAFYDWAVKEWKPGLQLDKDIRSGGHVGDLYCPECCCFTTRKKNMRRKSDNALLTYNGESLCVSEWAERTGMKRSTLQQRIDKNWTPEKIFTHPIKKYNLR